MGEYYLQLFDFKTERIWIVYCVVYMVFYVGCMTLGYFSLEYLRYEAPENIAVSDSPVEEEDVPKDTATQDRLESAYALATTPKALPKPGDNAILDVVPVPTSFTPVALAFRDLHYSVPKPSNPKESIELLTGSAGMRFPDG